MKLVSAAVLLSLLLSPLTFPGGESYAFSMAEYYRKNLELREEIELRQDYLSRVYIEQEYAAYILDEAHSLGMEGSVEVKVAWKDNVYVPEEVILSLTGADERERLSCWMESELGIPRTRQVWHGID